MKEAIQAWIRENRAPLLALDKGVARLVGAPDGHTLSGYSYEVEQAGKPWGEFWRPKIDAMAKVIFGQDDHCQKAFEKERSA